MKKLFIFLILTLLFIAACTPKAAENQMQPESKETIDTSETVHADTIPVLSTSDDVFSEIDSTIQSLE